MQQEDLRAWVLRGPDPEVDGISSYRLRDIAARTRELWGVTYTLSALSKLLLSTLWNVNSLVLQLPTTSWCKKSWPPCSLVFQRCS